jgi:hypothetical protein
LVQVWDSVDGKVEGRMVGMREDQGRKKGYVEGRQKGRGREDGMKEGTGG